MRTATSDLPAPRRTTGTEDTWDELKKLESVLELERKLSEQRDNGNSPYRPREEPEDPGGETVTPGSVHSVQKCPKSIRIERVDETNPPSVGIYYSVFGST